MNKDFSGDERQFAAGSVFGLRAWLASPSGLLIAPVQGEVFEPGINKATCVYDTSTSFRTMLWNGKPHRTGMTECVCGFYAYTNGRNPYYKQRTRLPMIQGVIEGSGVVTEGSRGFRCEKAELMGVVDPNAKSWWQPGSTWSFTVDIVFSLVYLASMAIAIAKADWWHVLWWLALVSLFGFYLSRDLKARRQTRVDPSLLDNIRNQYPEVEVFSSLRRLKKSYPLTHVRRLPFRR